MFKLLILHKITQKIKNGAITLISQFNNKTKLPSLISDPELIEGRAVCPPSNWGSLSPGCVSPSD